VASISTIGVSCPRCQKDDQVRKISVVASQNFGIGTAYSTAAETYVTRDFTTELGARLAEPKTRSFSCLELVLVFGLGFGAFAVLISIGALLVSGGNSNALLPVAFVGGCYAIGTIPLALVLRQSTSKKEAARKKAHAKWNELYYCLRDDLAFVPNTNIVLPGSQVQSYIWSKTHD